jgi:hypothetical protein
VDVKSVVCRVLLIAAIASSGTTVAAQSAAPLEQGRGLAWGSLGFQADLGGAVNRSGIGIVNGQRAEIDTNTWAERYDAALIFRFGGAYNLTSTSQLFAAITWEQSESDTTDVGLIGGQPLQAKFSDYQGTGFDAGYRYFFSVESKLQPFVAGSIGFQRLQDITISLSSAPFTVADVPFYDDSWVAGWRVGTGFLMDINDRLGWQVTVDLRYAGVMSDQSGIGTVGFERINDVGNRWTLPILAGAYVKF